MDRTIINPLEQMRDFDFVMFEHDALVGLGFLIEDILSGMAGGSVVSGFAVTSTTPASLTLNIAGGRIYTLAYPDPTAIGSIPQDVSTLCGMQGQSATQTITLTTPAVGQSQWNLIQVQFSTVDTVRTGDPNNGVVPFYNSTNPTIPNQASIATVRLQRAVLQVVQGIAATTGSEVPPQPSGGWTPLYLIDLAGGQSAITPTQVLPAGPSVGTNVPSNYTIAPFLSGFQASHHGGKPGQAPKINLTTEVQGVLPAANLPPNVLTGSFPTVRIMATSAITIYVSAAGSNANNGLSTNAPVQTIAHAYSLMQTTYDHNGFVPSIQLAAGTYPGTAFVGQLIGTTGFNLTGNAGAPATVAISGVNTAALSFTSCGVATITGFTVTSSGTPGNYSGSGHGIVVSSGATVQQAGTIILAACGGTQIIAGSQGTYSSNGFPIQITGSAQSAFGATLGGTLTTVLSSVSLVTGINFSVAVTYATECGVAQMWSMSFTGNVTGFKYTAGSNGVINTQGSGASYLPGSVAGFTISGGEYV